MKPKQLHKILSDGKIKYKDLPEREKEAVKFMSALLTIIGMVYKAEIKEFKEPKPDFSKGGVFRSAVSEQVGNVSHNDPGTQVPQRKIHVKPLLYEQ